MLGGAAALAILPAPAHATTLREALLKAYQGNPSMTGARAGQRAEDENVPIARAEGLPSISGTVDYSEAVAREGASLNSAKRNVTTRAQLTVPIYSGGAVKNAVRAADRRVQAGQADLRGTESSIFNAVVAAYMDVLRDSAIVSLNQKNVGVLEVNLQATRDRFEVGDLTRTDIAQSEARLAIARSDLQAAQARLIGSKERFIQLVGEPPVDLETPPPLPNLPDSPEAAVATALAENPDLEAIQKRREAARYDVNAAEASRLPRISGTTSWGYVDYLNSLRSDIPGVSVDQTNKSAAIGVQLSLPLYQGGRASARVRQAQARESQAIEGVTEVERSVIAQTRAAYASWRASNEVIASSRQAVEANMLSLEGVRAENSVGTRTILDILNAEQELLNAQVQLVTAERDSYVAGFTLLAAMGRAEAQDLGLDGGPLYDPVANYKRVKGIFWDFDRDRDAAPIATRTVDTPTQTPALIGPSQQ